STAAMRAIPDAAIPRLHSTHSTAGSEVAPRMDKLRDHSAESEASSPRALPATPRHHRPFLAPTAGLEPATRRLTEQAILLQNEELRHVAAPAGEKCAEYNPRCFTARCGDSSGSVTGVRVECMGSPGGGFATAGSQVAAEVAVAATAGSEVGPASEVAPAMATALTSAATTSEEAVRIAI